MKKIFFILFVLSGLCSKAQIIHIPDPDFKSYLIGALNLDFNLNNEIDSIEAATVTYMELDNWGVQDFTGINAFVNLYELRIQREHEMTTLSLSLPKLGVLYVNANRFLTTLNVINCPLLWVMTSNANYDDLSPGISHLTTINLAALPALQHINVAKNKLSSIDLSAVPGITGLEIYDNNFTTLPILPTTLANLSCGGNPMTSIDVSGNTSLRHLNCDNSAQLTSLNIHNCIVLEDLFCSNNPGITTLDLSNHNLNNLDRVLVNSCSLTTLNITGLNKLNNLNCSNNLLTELDCSTVPLLQTFLINDNPQLRAMNLKNGPTSNIPYEWIPGCPDLRYICTDDNEIYNVINRPDISVNSYCSFTPGGTFYNTIKGKVTWDSDNNGCGTGDPALPNLVMKLDNGTQPVYATNNSQGEYIFYSGLGNFTISPQIANPYFTSVPASANVNFATSGNIQIANFCLVPNGVHPDLEITILALNTARPGFDAHYQLVYKNKGNTGLSGNVELNFNDPRINFLNAIPAVSTQNTGVLTWAYSNLAAFESRSIDINFNLLPPPINNFNDTLDFTVNITPLAGDETPRDNDFIMRQVIRGSFDPNDKTCLEGAGILITNVGDYVHYLVRFQNTGTDTAFNVVIKDLLTTKFNWNSFEVTKTSHPFVLRQTAGNKLEFIFEDIKLPDSNVNEPASHGYIAFKIKTIPTLVLGDSIKNTASIYFDFNLPVITNTATSYIVSNIIVPISIEYFKGSKQTGNHLLNWKATCTSIQAIFDIERSTDGRKYTSLTSITASNTRCLQPFDFADNNPAAGMNYYRIKMTDVDGKVTYSSVIALLNKETGFEIVNLVPNPVIGGSASLNVTSAEKQIIHIKVSDASGKIVQSVDQTVISGFSNINMNFSKLAAGIYTIAVYTNEVERKTKQFVKQ